MIIIRFVKLCSPIAHYIPWQIYLWSWLLSCKYTSLYNIHCLLWYTCVCVCSPLWFVCMYVWYVSDVCCITMCIHTKNDVARRDVWRVNNVYLTNALSAETTHIVAVLIPAYTSKRASSRWPLAPLRGLAYVSRCMRGHFQIVSSTFGRCSTLCTFAQLRCSASQASTLRAWSGLSATSLALSLRAPWVLHVAWPGFAQFVKNVS